MNVAIVTDNIYLANALEEIIESQCLYVSYSFTYFCSPGSPMNEAEFNQKVTPIRLKTDANQLIGNYGIVLSAHCKQIFPPALVQSARCANIHPGLNPYNRGWFPQVFSILNGDPWGATFHIIDKELDHGDIIAQERLELQSWDTSLSAYLRVQEAEVKLLRNHLKAFLTGEAVTTSPVGNGNVNLKADFNELCALDLNAVGTLKDHIDLLRALTHGDYNNAYFVDKETGDEIYVGISLYREKSK
tara:strand:+ start:1557 stop:2291 length:735 start_codon:yes stop_codon:yes gene_type:complete